MKYCPTCGVQLDDDVRICPRCQNSVPMRPVRPYYTPEQPLTDAQPSGSSDDHLFLKVAAAVLLAVALSFSVLLIVKAVSQHHSQEPAEGAQVALAMPVEEKGSEGVDQAEPHDHHQYFLGLWQGTNADGEYEELLVRENECCLVADGVLHYRGAYRKLDEIHAGRAAIGFVVSAEYSANVSYLYEMETVLSITEVNRGYSMSKNERKNSLSWHNTLDNQLRQEVEAKRRQEGYYQSSRQDDSYYQSSRQDDSYYQSSRQDDSYTPMFRHGQDVYNYLSSHRFYGQGFTVSFSNGGSVMCTNGNPITNAMVVESFSSYSATMSYTSPYQPGTAHIWVDCSAGTIRDASGDVYYAR